MDRNNDKILSELNSLLENSDDANFCRALGEIAQRQGGFTQLSTRSELNRESLYKALSGERSPRFSTILDILAALGLRLRVEIDKESLEQELQGISGFEGAWLDLYLRSPLERLRQADQQIEMRDELSVIDGKIIR